jgi:hypothetical protein
MTEVNRARNAPIELKCPHEEPSGSSCSPARHHHPHQYITSIPTCMTFIRLEHRTLLRTHLSVAMLSLAVLLGCHGGDTHSDVQAPGRAKATDTHVLETGASLLQSEPPIRAINAYLDGFHFYNGHMKGQMEAHHFCAILNEDLIQCVIYDGNVKDAKIMGIEYIIGEKLFAGLSPLEKSLWHSHVHEVKSGQLMAPGIPAVAEHALMEKLIHTYGKTWHTWHTDLDKTLPLGIPQLMMGFTADGQANAAMVRARDQRLGVESNMKKLERQDIVAPPIDPDADGWQHGRTIQLTDPTGSQQDFEHTAGALETKPSDNSRSSKPE